MAASLYKLHVRFDVDAIHVFPQGLLVAFTLQEVGLKIDFLLAQWSSPPFQEWGLIINCWNRSSEVRSELTLSLYVCVFLPFLHWILAQEMEGVLKQRGFMYRQNFHRSSAATPLCLSWSIYLQLLFLLPCSESASQSKQRPCGLSPYWSVSYGGTTTIRGPLGLFPEVLLE